MLLAEKSVDESKKGVAVTAPEPPPMPGKMICSAAMFASELASFAQRVPR